MHALRTVLVLSLMVSVPVGATSSGDLTQARAIIQRLLTRDRELVNRCGETCMQDYAEVSEKPSSHRLSSRYNSSPRRTLLIYSPSELYRD